MGQYVTFTLDDSQFGVDVFYSLEINDRTVYTPVPGADPCIRGLLNLRGDIVTMIDLRVRLGLNPREHGKTMNLILKTEEEVMGLNVNKELDMAIGNERVGLVIDEVGDILTVDDEAIERVPAVDREQYNIECIQGVHQQEGTLLMILDVARIVDMTVSTGELQ